MTIEITVSLMESIRTAYNKRATVVGGVLILDADKWVDGTVISSKVPPSNNQMISFYQTKIENIISSYYNDGGANWSKGTLFTAHGIGDGLDWTRVPSTSYGKLQENDVVYEVHFTEMQTVLEQLTKVRRFATSAKRFRKTRTNSDGPTAGDDDFEGKRSTFEVDFDLASPSELSVDATVLNAEDYAHSHVAKYKGNQVSDIDSSATNFNFSGESLDLAPDDGHIRIGSEIIGYHDLHGETDGPTFTRAQMGTAATSHPAGSGAYVYGSENMNYSSTFVKTSERVSYAFDTNLHGYNYISAFLAWGVTQVFKTPGDNQQAQACRAASQGWAIVAPFATHSLSALTGDDEAFYEDAMSFIEPAGSTYVTWRCEKDDDLEITPSDDPIADFIAEPEGAGDAEGSASDSTDLRFDVEGHEDFGGIAIVIEVDFS